MGRNFLLTSIILKNKTYRIYRLTKLILTLHGCSEEMTSVHHSKDIPGVHHSKDTPSVCHSKDTPGVRHAEAQTQGNSGPSEQSRATREQPASPGPREPCHSFSERRKCNSDEGAELGASLPSPKITPKSSDIIITQ